MLVSEKAQMEFQGRKPKPPGSCGEPRGLLLGPMAQVFFSPKDQSSNTPASLEETRLEGPSGPMLLFPEDLLQGRQVLREPYPRRKVQAWKHQAILVIGQKIEEQLLAALAKQCEEAIKAKEEEMKAAMEKAIEEAVKKAIKSTKRKMDHSFRDKLREFIKLQAEYIEDHNRKLCSRFEAHLKESLDMLRQETSEEKELAVRRERQICTEEADFKMQKEKYDIKTAHAKEMEAARIMIEFLQSGILPKKVQDKKRECAVRN